jgi:flavorubredoxin
MLESRNVTQDTTIINSYMPVPGFGVLPVNAFVIRAEEPALIDTGLTALRSDFMRELNSVIDPQDLRWIWITHTDPDHIGNLEAVLTAAPHARVVTTYLGMGKLGLHQIPLDRVYLLNPDQRLSLGDREIRAVAPPCFDAPETMGLFDDKSKAFYSADCFGALMDRPVAAAEDISSKALRDGCVTWSTVDAPWLSETDPVKFGKTLKSIEGLNAEIVLSSHLPPARNLTHTLLENLAAALDAPRFIGPDQKALEKMMAA